jgi:hypothetical protein
MAEWIPRTPVPSPDEIEAGKTAAGGYTASTLKQWGVPWPPPTGWKQKLRAEWQKEHPPEHRPLQGPPKPGLVKYTTPCPELGNKIHAWQEVTQPHHKMRMYQCTACGARAARPARKAK